MSVQIIPLTNDPNQTLQTTVNVDGRNLSLKLTIRYNEMAGYWVMGVANPSSGAMYLDSIPLVPGNYPAANILAQYSYLGIGSAYIYNAGNVAAEYPDADTLGSEWVLIWSDTE